MDFATAMNEVKTGHRLRRDGWPDSHHVCVKKGYLMLYKEDAYFTWIISESDLYAHDWEYVPNA